MAACTAAYAGSAAASLGLMHDDLQPTDGKPCGYPRTSLQQRPWIQEVAGVNMHTAYAAVTVLAIAANAFSGIAAIVHFKPILPGMARAGVPESWLTFPIGTLKTAGAAGLLLGLIGVPWIGAAAAIGLILFFTCALYTHVRASDYSLQFGLAIGFFLLAVAALALDLVARSKV